MSKFITTTLPYLNSKPHIGHAFEFIIGDALSRYFKKLGEQTFFNIGFDEHGLKIQKAAESKGVTPKEYVDSLLPDWIDFLNKLKIDSYDKLYRTSDIEHINVVQQFWEEALNRGDIYKKKYSGKYCVGCESFKTDRDLVDKIFFGVDPVDENSEIQSTTFRVCPDHPTSMLSDIEEENYFFRLSKYKTQLSNWAHKSVDFLEPISKRVEFLKVIDSIQDISISRVKENVSWGVPVPGDDGQTIYVWMDALLNYISAAGYYLDEYIFDNLWSDSEVIQICGPDNLKFQSVIFQGLLTSAGIKKSDKLLVHGTILDDKGRKMSKSEGNVIDPIEQIDKFGVDAVRYYALAGLSTYSNSSWDEKQLVELYNSHLADDYGNLVVRVTVLADKIFNLRSDKIALDYEYIGNFEYCKNFDESLKEINYLWETYKISEALSELNKLVKELNKYITIEEPWKDLESKSEIVFQLLYCISKVNNLYYPVFPTKSGEIKKAIADCKKTIIFPKIEL